MNLNLKQLRQEYKQNRLISKTLSFRLKVLIELAKRQSQITTRFTNLDYCLVADQFKISKRTLQRWLSSYLNNGVKGLTSKTHSNHPIKPITGWTAKKITDCRMRFNWGAETIQAHLKYDDKIELSQYRINKFLKENKFIKKIKKKKLKNKHTKIITVDTPGIHTQTDVKHLPKMIQNKKVYIYNFVDHASRWEYKEAFDSYNPFNTKIFFTNVLKNAPFKIISSQTDNGVEFTNKFISHVDNPRLNCFEEYLFDQKIKHRLIPPGEKELNGLVERSHRTDDEELYHRIQPRDLRELNKELQEHCKWRNESRRKKPLGWKTTSQWLFDYEIKMIKENEFKLADTG